MPPPKMAVMIGLEKPDTEEVAETKKDYEGPEIRLPEGYTPPDDSQPNEDISVLAKIRIKPNGKACLVSLDGAPYEKEETQKVKEEVTESVEKPAVEGGQKTGVMDGGSLSERIGNVRRKIQKSGY